MAGSAEWGSRDSCSLRSVAGRCWVLLSVLLAIEVHFVSLRGRSGGCRLRRPSARGDWVDSKVVEMSDERATYSKPKARGGDR